MNSSLHRIAGLLLLAVWSAPASAQSELRAYYQDDFILETLDRTFQLKIRGNLHLDGRLYQAENRGAPHSIDIRRARIDLQGRIHERFTFRVQPEFAGQPYIRNAWMDAELWPWLHLRLGQMKVPFSSSWLTLDNNVNFVERGAAPPIFPFFDRGALLWGELWEGRLTYNLGIYTGTGVDLDVGSGDWDDSKDLCARLLWQPFPSAGTSVLSGLYLAAQGTWGKMSRPTARYETKGYRSANFETAIWRWRTEQTLGSDGRTVDQVSSEIDSRFRLGGELHYLLGPFTLSAEYLENHYREIALYHDLYVGSSRKVHHKLTETSGTVRSLSVWASIYLTGESKKLTNLGWKTPRPNASVGQGGPGAWEILGRYSRTWTGRNLFSQLSVAGFGPDSPELPGDYSGTTPGIGQRLTASVLDGAHLVHEVTLGLCWTVNPMIRIQLNDVFLWAPPNDRDGDGSNDNLLVSGAHSDQSNPELKNRKTSWENAVMARMIFKL